MTEPRIEKATITHLATLESLGVLWNPERYFVSRRSRLSSSRVPGASLDVIDAIAGGTAEFSTDLLLDRSRPPYRDADLEAWSDTLASWMEAPPGESAPPRVLFSWGSFRFRGILSALDSLWVRFDAEGKPLRGWLRLTLTRSWELET